MEWIAMKDERPEFGGKYLCTDGEDIEIMHYHGAYKNSYDWSSYTCNTLNVTHWMKLPSLPKVKD